ncbi:hypothetical protein Misp01_42870 [Microtetraspora sp. NBRC 13810]|uniref:hypothetical protein n=1 Tax=Microtetraspora sp. NBRC 13810 TaxID=3030990 RepID=UPI0024A57720|nr:hypothetical protein [Microtetraspora sp. NBRC 13810]GLW09158.1 hypothetical protein Misp01_42870 [Microtetraspora sp. NBRC 13810]
MLTLKRDARLGEPATRSARRRGSGAGRRIGALLGTLAMTAAMSIAATPPAQAAPWLSDPGSCTNVQTGRQADGNGYTVQIRYGTCGGVQYGWGRVLNGRADMYVFFEVDITGDRRSDGNDSRLIGTRNYTSGYATASGSTRAFRACVIKDPTWDCNAASVVTAWW